MKTICLEHDDIYKGALLLINADNPIRKPDTDDLISFDFSFPDIRLKHNAANALQAVLRKVSAGTRIIPVSGYRTEDEQTAIYDKSIKDNGMEFTKKYVAMPGRSEHQTGLAIDLGVNKENIDFICPDFSYEGICEKFRKAAPDYGYIQRYKEDKEKITGISHEPWHFRYVGFPHSKIIEKNKLSLEEYTEFIKKYQENNKYIYTDTAGLEIAVYYVEALEGKTCISVPETHVYQISGNNVDGFIITVWNNRYRA